jgi:hypothetical protein
VGLFDAQSVKALREKSAFFGGLVGDVALGSLAREHMDAMLTSERERSQLRGLFDAAAQDVGPDKAMKAAVKGARMAVEVRCDMANAPRRPHVDTAEDVVREILTNS